MTPRSQEAFFGLCNQCRFQRVIVSARGSQFMLCKRAQSDKRFAKYPAVPVYICHGFEGIEEADTTNMG